MNNPSFSAKSIARVNKKKRKMSARRRERVERGTNIILFSSLNFSTHATDVAEKERLLVIVTVISGCAKKKTCSLVLKCSYRFERT